MTQKERIIEWFKDHSKLDRLQAFTELGCFELSARICELQENGYIFEKQKKSKLNRFGDKFNYVEYTLLNKNGQLRLC